MAMNESSDSSESDSDNNANSLNSHQNNSHDRPPRRPRQSKPFYKLEIATTKFQMAEFSETNLLSAIAPYATDVLQSYPQSASTHNFYFWGPGIMRDEHCIIDKNTFTLMERNLTIHVLPRSYVFKVKIGRSKARIIAKYFLKVYGVDYHDKFAQL